MKFPSFIVAALGLQLAWLPMSTHAAQTDHDGGWAGNYSCSAVITNPSQLEFSNVTKLTIANGNANGEFIRNTKLGKEVENWTGSITNGNLNLVNAARREDGAIWTLRFNGSISGSDKISISGEMLGGTGQKVRDCKLAISLITPSQASLVGKAKIAEENQARQKLAIDSEKKRIVADKEALAAQTRKLEADRNAALKEQAQIAEINKLQIEQQAKLVAEKDEELAAQAQKIEEEKAAANKIQAEIAEKNRLLVEQQAKLVAEKESANNIQFLLFALSGLFVTGFVVYLAVRRNGTTDNKHKESTSATIEVQDDTNVAQEVKAQQEIQELSLREQVATLQKEKDALIAKEQVAALEAQKEAALYQSKIEKLEQERLTAIAIDNKDREKTSEALRISSADARISIPLTANQTQTEQALTDKLKAKEKQAEIQTNYSFNESKEKLFNFAKNVKDSSIKVSEDLRSDETKSKIKDFANQAQSFASEKTKELKDELNKINEARKATANEAKDFQSTSKIEKSKTVALSFWSKLTAKQKGIFISIPLIITISIGMITENNDSKSIGPVSDSSKKNIEYALKKAKMTRDELQNKVVEQLKDDVFDPASMQYKNAYFYYSVNSSNGHLQVGFCGKFNAKNRMGGYVPFEDFSYYIDVDESPMSKKLIPGYGCPYN